MRKILLNRKFVTVLVLWMSLISIPPSNAFAMPSDSIAAFTMPSVRESQIENILMVLSRPEARAQLMLMGINQTTLKEKLNQLDDRELNTVSQKVDSVKAGGDALGLVIVLLVIAILVVLLLKLSDKTLEVKDKK